jgi:hypothetical protein
MAPQHRPTVQPSLVAHDRIERNEVDQRTQGTGFGYSAGVTGPLSIEIAEHFQWPGTL